MEIRSLRPHGSVPTRAQRAEETSARGKRVDVRAPNGTWVRTDGPEELVDCTSRLELTARRWNPSASAEDLAGVLGEVLADSSGADRMLRSLDVLLPEDGARVVQFLQSKRQPGGPLAHLTLAQALDDFMSVIGTRVLHDNLDALPLGAHRRGARRLARRGWGGGQEERRRDCTRLVICKKAFPRIS